MIAGVKCDGLEESLSDCYHEEVGDVSCPEIQYIAGVVCSFGKLLYCFILTAIDDKGPLLADFISTSLKLQDLIMIRNL